MAKNYPFEVNPDGKVRVVNLKTGKERFITVALALKKNVLARNNYVIHDPNFDNKVVDNDPVNQVKAPPADKKKAPAKAKTSGKKKEKAKSGTDQIKEWIQLAVQKKIISIRGNHYFFADAKLGLGINKAVATVEANKEILEMIQNELKPASI